MQSNVDTLARHVLMAHTEAHTNGADWATRVI